MDAAREIPRQGLHSYIQTVLNEWRNLQVVMTTAIEEPGLDDAYRTELKVQLTEVGKQIDSFAERFSAACLDERGEAQITSIMVLFGQAWAPVTEAAIQFQLVVRRAKASATIARPVEQLLDFVTHRLYSTSEFLVAELGAPEV
jgi:hypothetical protein